jgi:hypothetical protein
MSFRGSGNQEWNRITRNYSAKTEVDDPMFRATLNSWLTAFNWIFVVFLVFQIALAIAAVRSI